MKMYRILLSLVAVVSMAALFCPGTPPAAPPAATTQTAPAAVQVTILHINDVHGHTQSWNDAGRSVGGYARLSTLLEDIRTSSTSARVFFVHAGDELSRGDALTRRTLGAANVEILSYLRLDMMTPGNGDFYDGAANLQKLMGTAKFPFLAANVTMKAGGQPLGKPYVIERVGPLRIAFFGLCFVRTDLPSADPLKVTDPVETAKALVPVLRKQADLVVAVTHLGFGADEQLARSVDGIDVILGGHSHTSNEPKGVRVRTPSGGQTLVCQAGEYLKLLGEVELTCEAAGDHYKLVSASERLIPIDEKTKLDPKVTALIAKMSDAGTPASRPAPVPAGAK